MKKQCKIRKATVSLPDRRDVGDKHFDDGSICKK